jgi:gamma-butyrobetaine dioxygenase
VTLPDGSRPISTLVAAGQLPDLLRSRDAGADLRHLPPRGHPDPAEARASTAAPRDRWAGEDHVSRYPLDMLAAYADGRAAPDPADLPRRPWFADHYPNVTRVSHPVLLDSADERRRWMEALLIEGIAIVTDMPDTDEALTRTAGLLGTIRPSFFGEYFDVRTHVKPTNLAYTSKALELHTDVPAEELAPGIQYLHCRRNSVEGGRNLFLDGTAVANDLREADPEAFRLLARPRCRSTRSMTASTCARASG